MWRLLLGAMGSAMCAGDPWAAQTQPGGGTSGNSTEDFPVLRMSLQIGEGRKALRPRKPAARDAPAAKIAWAPLRLAPSIEFGSVPINSIAAAPRAGTFAVDRVSAQTGAGDDGGSPQPSAPVPFGPSPAASPVATTAALPRAAAAPVRTVAVDRVSERSGVSDQSDDGAPPQPSAPVPFDPAAGPASRRPQPASDGPVAGQGSPGSGIPDLSGESWTMAPIRWQGNSTTAGTMFGDDRSTIYGVNNNLALSANSFIVAPYIATWSGNFGLNSTNFQSIPDVGPKTTSESSGHNLGGNISVFSASNFPFNAYVAHGQSEFTSGKTKNVPNSSTAFGFEQQYRTADGRDRYSARYDLTSITSGNSEGSSSTMQGSYSTRRIVAPENFLEGEHLINANVLYSPPSTDFTGQGGQQFNVGITHGWRVHEDLSISNLLSLVNTQQKQFQGNTLNSNDSTLMLGSSTFNWRPDEDWPLDVGGGASFGYTQSQTAEAAQTSQNFFTASLSATYRYSNQLTMAAGAAVSTTTSDSGRSNQAFGNVGGYYTGLPIQFGPYTYGWSAGAGINANVGNQGNSGAGANVSASHNVMREFVIDERQGASLTAAQSVSYSLLPDAGSAVSLSNSAGAGWRASYGDALSGSLGASAGFTTTSDGSNSYSASLQGSGNYLISSRQSLSFNANVNWVRTPSGSSNTQPQVLNQVVVDENQTQMTGIVSLNYAHTSPFSIRNLTYTADLLWVGNQSNQKVIGAPSVSSGNGTSVSLQQLARYRVGRLSFALSAAVINAGGTTGTSVFGSVTRDFDGFFDGRW